MGRLIIRIVINAVALWVASLLLPGITVNGAAAAAATGGHETLGLVLAFLFIGLIFGLVNAIIGPVVRLLSLPVTILTLGLFTIIINAALLMLTSWISGYTPIQFRVDSFFWTAILAALIISVVSLIIGALTRSRS